jgi:signal transduction histidine kinase
LPIQIDPRRIGQVCRNLLANAIRLSPPGAPVSIVIKRGQDAGHVTIEVADRGPGIPEDELEAIFDRFSQSSKTKTGAGGTGLGLTISRSIVELHGGTLVARNRDGGGAVFALSLPLQ